MLSPRPHNQVYLINPTNDNARYTFILYSYVIIISVSVAHKRAPLTIIFNLDLSKMYRIAYTCDWHSQSLKMYFILNIYVLMARLCVCEGVKRSSSLCGFPYKNKVSFYWKLSVSMKKIDGLFFFFLFVKMFELVNKCI